MTLSYRLLAFLFIGLMVSSITIFSSCNKDDDDEGSTAVELLSFGPSPALRGGELKIIGRNLDRVSAVVLPDNVTVDNFDSQTTTLITLTIPEATVEGHIVLKSLDGDIESISILTISEPIVLTSFSPASVRPGDVLTISGEYLNLITAVIFLDGQVVEAADFISQTKEQIEVTVPEAAQSGPVTLSNGEEIPILVASEDVLEVKLPQVTGISPNPVKAGSSLTITGTDLDLAQQVIFTGADPVTTFSSQSATSIVVEVPDNAHDGAVKLQAASLLQTQSEDELVMVVPTITSLAPLPVKNGADLTITGTDLDLATSVSFGGGTNGTIVSIAETELTVTVPMGATDAPVTVFTAADKNVSSADPVTLVVPTLSSINPTEAQFGDEITLQGTDLDLVTHVLFTGDVQANVNMATTDMATVNIPVAAQTGPITMVTTNGTNIVSTFDLTLLVSTNAVITNIPEIAAPGEMISIEGENLDEINEVIFPGDVPATMFGTKTATLIEVFVPLATEIGPGNIKFITFTGEEFFSPEINFQ
ncbi:MAG: IPT/TIG domain-containing protein, partial [Lewinella sp.]|nr:IPT/TIG domain-containing protein [Lewinella sp.]